MEEFIDIFHKGGLRTLVNHLLDKLYAKAKVSRRCLPTKVCDLTDILDEIETIDLEHRWVKGPEGADGKYNAFNVIYHLKTIANVEIDMGRVSKDNELIIAAILTGCLHGSLGRYSSPKNVLEAGLDIAKEIAALPSDSSPHFSPPPYPQQPSSMGRPGLTPQ